MKERMMNGKTVLITGATDGIGKEAARQLVQIGARVVIVGRNPDKTQRVLTEIKQKVPYGQVESLLADLSSQAQIRELANAFLTKHKRLDVLINNAGTSFLRRQISQDGIEMTLAVNHIAYFLLSNLLLDMLKDNAPSRIVSTSSSAHYRQILDLDDLNMEHGYQFMRAYSQSKLANVMFTYELARRLEGSGVTANVLHPGFVRTNVARSDNGLLLRLLQPLIFRFGVPVEKGAETIVYLASSPEVADASGKYFEDKREKRSAKISYDREKQKKLWAISEKMVGL